ARMGSSVMAVFRGAAVNPGRRGGHPCGEPGARAGAAGACRRAWIPAGPTAQGLARAAAGRVRCRTRAPFTTAAHGMSAGSVDTARMKGGWGLVAVAGLALAVLAPPSFAGTIYRCDTADGQRSYVSKRIKGASCKAVTSYRS